MLVDVAVHLIIAVSFALAAAKLHPVNPALRSTTFWTLVAFCVFFLAPPMVFLLRLNPEWFLHYLWTVDGFSWPLALVQLLPLAVAVGAYLGTRRLLLTRPGRLTEFVLLVASFAVGGLIVLVGWSRIAVVGTTADVVADARVRDLAEASEGYLAAGALSAIGIGALFTVWRVFVFARAIPVAPRYTGSVPVRDGHTKALPRSDDSGEGDEPKKKARARG